MNTIILETIGWIGTAMILAAYFLSSMNFISTSSKSYQFLNTVGAICIVIISLKKNLLQAVILNLIWAIIGLIGFFKNKEISK